MKTQAIVFFFFTFSISLFSQDTNIDKCRVQIIEQLPHLAIKPLADNYRELNWEQLKYQICYHICGRGRCLHDPNQVYIPLCGFFPAQGDKLLRSKRMVRKRIVTKVSNCANFSTNCTAIIGTNRQKKKRYIALKELHNRRYPNIRGQKTPELQPTLQEIRF